MGLRHVTHMADNNKIDETPRLVKIIQELDVLSNWFETAVKLVISIPLFINATAAIALTSFFSNNDCPHFSIKWASLFFILGTVFGIFTLIFEYLTPLFAKETSKKYFFENPNQDNFINELLKRHEAYASSKEARHYKTIKIRMMNGGAGILLCLIGIFFIARYIIGSFSLLIMSTLLLALYFTLITYLLYQNIRPK